MGRARRGLLVHLEFDRERSGPDGDWLAYVYLPNGRMLNAELIRVGLARPRDDGPEPTLRRSLRGGAPDSRARPPAGSALRRPPAGARPRLRVEFDPLPRPDPLRADRRLRDRSRRQLRRQGRVRGGRHGRESRPADRATLAPPAAGGHRDRRAGAPRTGTNSVVRKTPCAHRAARARPRSRPTMVRIASRCPLSLKPPVDVRDHGDGRTTTAIDRCSGLTVTCTTMPSRRCRLR